MPADGDLDELGLVLHVLDGGAAAVAHAGAHAAGHLVDDRHHRALVRHAAFDAFGHELVGVRVAGGRFLEVAVGAALLHRADASPCRGSSCSCGPGTARSRPAPLRCRRTCRPSSRCWRRPRWPWRCRPSSGCRRRRSAARRCPAARSATLSIAMICGTPTPATMRVVQIEPGPMPTLTASAPASTSAARRRRWRCCRR